MSLNRLCVQNGTNMATAEELVKAIGDVDFVEKTITCTWTLGFDENISLEQL